MSELTTLQVRLCYNLTSHGFGTGQGPWVNIRPDEFIELVETAVECNMHYGIGSHWLENETGRPIRIDRSPEHVAATVFTPCP